VALLGDVLALRAGSDYGTLLRTRIIAPLKMNDTGLHLTAEMKAHLIPGHNLRLEKRSEWGDVALEPAGGIYSTVDDLLIFLAANMGLTKSPLQPAMKEMVRVRRSAGNGVDVGLGWHILTGYNELIFHNGLTNGYFTLIGFEPHRKVGIVVLSNANVPNDLGRRILDYPGSRPVEENIGPPNLPH
jgi:CubicO group peptidase (beta-lactamase class C family)